ncbi:MAG: hypothetical protein ABIJ56_04355 [Pseudomonadota bacterium]
MRQIIILTCMVMAAGACKAGTGKEPGQVDSKEALNKSEQRHEKAVEEAQAKKKQAETEEKARADHFIQPPVKAEDLDPAALVAECARRMGGLDKLRGVKTASVRLSLKGSHNLDLHNVVKIPDKARMDYYSGEKILSSVMYDGQQGWQVTDGEAEKLSETRKRDLLVSMKSDPIPLLLAATEPGAKLEYLGKTRVVDSDAHAVKIELPGLAAITFYIDAEDHEFLGSRYETSQGVTTVIESDYRDVSGIRVAHISQIITGSTTAVAVIKEVSINSEVSDETFKPPK